MIWIFSPCALVLVIDTSNRRKGMKGFIVHFLELRFDIEKYKSILEITIAGRILMQAYVD
jgi:hypothetical protein